MTRRQATKPLLIKRRSAVKAHTLLLSGLLVGAALIAPVQTLFATNSTYEWSRSDAKGVQWRSWKDIASSADGTKLAAVANSDFIHTSTDSGATWTARESSGNSSWTAIASSADGTKLAAVSSENSVYVSNDSGITWTARAEAGSGNWVDVALSADGSKLFAVQGGEYIYTPEEGTVYIGGHIYTSADNGVSWTERGDPLRWKSITSSADGMKLAAAVEGGYIYTSADNGVSWTERGDPHGWTSLAASANGMTLLAVSNAFSDGNTAYHDDDIYISSDGGVSWSARGESVGFGWNSAAVSADGQHLAAGGENRMRISVNGGESWEDRTEAEFYNWAALTYSADGSLLAGVPNYQAHIRTSTTDAQNWTTIPVLGMAAWYDVLVSSDGNVIFLQDSTGYIHRSTDGGNTWITDVSMQERILYNVSMSANGNKLIGVCDYILCISTNGGVTWEDSISSEGGSWDATAISGDGTKMIAVDYDLDTIYTSDDNGENWVSNTPSESLAWKSVLVSHDGQEIIAVPNNGAVYRSGDGGEAWAPLTIPGSQNWDAAAVSSDGTTIAISNTDDELYISTDKGVTWNQRTTQDSHRWETVAISANGQYLIGATDNNSPWISMDKGVTWNQYETGSLLNRWSKAAITANGTKVFAGENAGNFYIGNLISSEDETPPEEETPPAEEPSSPSVTQPPATSSPPVNTSSETLKTTSTTTITDANVDSEASDQPLIDLMSESTFRAGDEYKVEVASGQVLSFKANDAPHTFTVDNIRGNTVTFTIRSTPQTHTLRVGETGKYDVDGDKTDDISVTVNNVTNGVAQLTMVNLLATKVSVLSMPQDEANDTSESAAKPSFNYGLIVWIAGGVIALLIAIMIIRKTKRA
ncbi:MAG TPA: YCF48-related protein [Candidatus Saccharimonadales bacterium]